jgi:uncharacterized membrane-anchored protein
VAQPLSSIRESTPQLLISRVPQIVALFWVIKVLSTGMGEATSDYLVHAMPPPLAAALGGIAFLVALKLQLSQGRYVAWAYWLAVVMVAVFGTMLANGLHVELHVPYAVSTPFFAVILAIVFVAWYRSEGTLSIHSIFTPRRELYYWATVMATFALGTAAGDLTATTLGLGWFASGVLFTVIIAIPAIGFYWFGMNPIVAFWFAYIVTRPLGASYADWLGLPPRLGGVGLGRGTVAVGGAIAIAALVGYLSITKIDAPRPVGQTVEAGVEPRPEAERPILENG